ncbi:alpha/beta-hydrolase [Setomelanomma holmii]|uniref:Alpha/beta-hydrolase n=1 Tax=Setomelanomma holmii TaxID=210430 RepID=A0A9P4HJ46_9PLEO|nr:alpha/beta-hydrolase [Setomelanomma holmii]
MPPSSPTFICIPGAFSPSTYFHKLVSHLTSLGHTVQAIDLPSTDPSVRAQGATPGLYADAEYVRNSASSALDAGHDVILVANSYGSAVAMEACKTITPSERTESGKTGGQLKHLVLLGGLLMDTGITVQELLGDKGPPVDMSVSVTYIEPIPPVIAGAMLVGSLPKEEQEQYGAMGKAICVQAFLEPLTFAAWKEVPTTVVVGANDAALAPEMQSEYFEKAAEKGVKGLRKVVIEGGDHLCMLSHPEEVGRVCLEAAGLET